MKDLNEYITESFFEWSNIVPKDEIRSHVDKNLTSFFYNVHYYQIVDMIGSAKDENGEPYYHRKNFWEVIEELVKYANIGNYSGVALHNVLSKLLNSGEDYFKLFDSLFKRLNAKRFIAVLRLKPMYKKA